MTEREKMDQGLWHNANYDEALVQARLDAEDLCFELNHTRPSDSSKREDILTKLLPHRGADTVILSPFYTDYGTNCRIGEATFINHNAYLMDGGGITIGSHCFIGPNCGMYTANHPMIAKERNRGLEQAKPIAIGDNVWIGADVTILPGVTIGEGCVIGAKSLVNRDIPAGMFAAGVPCRVIRPITENDRIKE